MNAGDWLISCDVTDLSVMLLANCLLRKSRSCSMETDLSVMLLANCLLRKSRSCSMEMLMQLDLQRMHQRCTGLYWQMTVNHCRCCVIVSVSLLSSASSSPSTSLSSQCILQSTDLVAHIFIIIIIISTTMFMVLSSWQSHCESLPGSFDECRMAPSGRQPKTKPDDLGCESACTGCQKLHPRSPFIITQPES